MRTTLAKGFNLDTPATEFDRLILEQAVDASNHDISSPEATTAIKNLKLFSDARPPSSTPAPDLEPTTALGKARCVVGRVWDNETTRVLIKAGGAFAGVAVVAWSTIHKDHIIERQALAQANQRPV